jgi:hypothetical protein
VLILSDPWGGSFGLLHRPLNSLGFTTAELSLPGFGKASAMHASATIDDVMDAIRASITQLDAPPVCIAPSHVALAMQYYLESYPLAGLVMISPLPPRLGPMLTRWTGDAMPTRPAIAEYLRRCAASEAYARASVLAPDVDADSVEAFLVESEAATMIDDAGGSPGGGAGQHSRVLCGVDAAARLIEAMSAVPLQLEPQPIPMLCISAASDQLITATERAATPAWHHLGPEDIIELPAPHLIAYGGDDVRSAAVSGIVRWVNARW